MPLTRMEYGSVGQAYVLLAREAGSMTMGKLGACLQFTVKEIDPSTGMLARSARGSGLQAGLAIVCSCVLSREGGGATKREPNTWT